VFESESVGKTYFAILKAKYVFPTDSDPAKQVILLDGTPPHNEPDNNAFRLYDPVSTKVVQSPTIPLATTLAKSFSVTFIKCLTILLTDITNS
jgi:hypothetical protein